MKKGVGLLLICALLLLCGGDMPMQSAAGLSVSDLSAAGVSVSDLSAAGVSVSDLSAAGLYASDMSVVGLSAFGQPAVGLSVSDSYIDDSYIITLKDKACGNEVCRSLEAVFGSGTETEICGSFVFLTLSGQDTSFASAQALISEIPGVAACERDAKMNLMNLTFPLEESTENINSVHPRAFTQDIYSNSQWTLNNSGSYESIVETSVGTVQTTPDIDIDAPEGWEAFSASGTESRPVVVAVIDTGVDYRHRDLKDEMWINPGEIAGDGIDNDGNGYIDDIYGWDFYNRDSSVCHYKYNAQLKLDLSNPADCDDHGTHVAGIIAATRDNKIGIAGVASNIDVKIMSLKIHGGENRSGSVSNAIKAIAYASVNGADLINMSWGTYSESDALYTAIKECGLLVVAAAGNDGSDNDTKPLYPASFDLDNILSVSYVDANGRLTASSNYGKHSVDIAVPSVDVYSTVVGSYSSMSGSSMAAAHAAGIAAVLMSSGTGYYAQNVKDVMLKSIKHLENTEKFILSGGTPSLKLAAENLSLLESDLKPPTIVSKRTFEGSNIILNISAVDGESGINQVRYLAGRQSIDRFANGTLGTAVENGKIVLAKDGTYTVYVRDNAMNARSFNIVVTDDKTAPSVSYTYKASYDRKKYTVTAEFTDRLSGVKTTKYAAGEKSSSDFIKTSFGNLLETKNGIAEFTVPADDVYTLYAADYRGNKTTVPLELNIIPSEELTLSRTKKTLYTGGKYKISASLLPENTTDVCRYTSSNKAVATVTKKGTVKAVAPGKCSITVKTPSGLKKKIYITVKEAPAK